MHFDCKKKDWLNYLINLGMKKIKIPSGEINNLPFFKKAEFKKF